MRVEEEEKTNQEEHHQVNIPLRMIIHSPPTFGGMWIAPPAQGEAPAPGGEGALRHSEYQEWRQVVWCRPWSALWLVDERVMHEQAVVFANGLYKMHVFKIHELP